MFKKYVPLDGMILDAGAGTEGVGELLHYQGFLNLIRIDISSYAKRSKKESNYSGTTLLSIMLILLD